MGLSIRTKLVLATVVPVLAGAAVFLAVGLPAVQQHTRALLTGQLRESGERHAAQIDAHLREAMVIARSSAGFFGYYPDISDADLYGQLRRNVLVNPLVYGAAAAFEPGTRTGRHRYAPYAYRAVDGLRQMDIAADAYDYTAPQWEWWRTPRQRWEAIWTAPYFDEGAGHVLMVTYAAPFFVGEEFRGVTTVDLNLATLRDTLQLNSADQRGYVIVTNTGHFAHHYRPELIGRMNRSAGDEGLADPVRRVLSGSRGLERVAGADGGADLVYYAPIRSAGWGLLVRVPESVLFAFVRTQYQRFALWLAGTLALIAIAASVAARRITQPLATLTDAATAIGHGERPITLDIATGDELHSLGHSFTNMAARLADREQALESQTRDLGARVNELNCIFALSQLTARSDLTLEQVLAGAVGLLPAAFRQPAGTGARIRYRELEFATPGQQAADGAHHARLVVGGEPAGEVAVWRVHGPHAGEELPLRDEELRLVQEFANLLAAAIERRLADAAVRRLNQTLERRIAERTAELAESEQRMTLALEAGRLGLWDLNLQTGAAYRSPGWYVMYGYEPGELLPDNDSWQSLLHPDDRQRVLAAMDDYVSRSATGFEIEFRMLTRTGEIRDILARGRVLPGHDGTPARRMLGIHTDVTEFRSVQREIEAQARADEALNDFSRLLLEVDVDQAIATGLRALGEQLDVDAIGYWRFEDGGGFVVTQEWRRRGASEVGLRVAPEATVRMPWQFRQLLRGRTVALGSLADLPPEAESDRAFLAGRNVEGYIVAPSFIGGRLAGCTYFLSIGRPRHWEPLAYRLLRNINELIALGEARRQADAALAASEEHFRSLVGNLPGVVYRHESRDGWRLRFISDAIERLSGFPAAEFRDHSRSLSSLTHHEDRARVHDAISACIVTGSIYRLEYRMLTGDGGTRWVLEQGRAINDDGGVPRYLDGSIFDITERKAAEEQLAATYAELERSRAQLQAILDNSPALIWLTDPTGRLLVVNRRWREVLGVEGDVAGRLLQDLVPPGVGRQLIESDRRVLEAGRTIVTEEPIEQADGPHWYVACRFLLRDADDRIQAIGAIATDITGRKQAELALQDAKDVAETATQAKATFLASMSHEIRTPMNGVIGMLDLLLQSPLDADQKQMARTMRDSAQALLTIINDILDFSKIESGKLEIERIPMSIRDAVESVADTLATTTDRKGLRFLSDIDPTLPARALGDQVRIRQILFNLAGNAIKFTSTTATREGRVALRARVAAREADALRVRFEIEDNGIGMTRETLDTLFQPFTQAESSTTRRFGGTGLGLSICKRLVDMMGGTIGVRSEPGQGSLFWVELPLPVPAYQGDSFEQADFAGLHVLTAIDAEDLRDVVTRYLGHWRAEVTAAPRSTARRIALGAASGPTPFRVMVIEDDPQHSLLHALRAEPPLADLRYVVLVGRAGTLPAGTTPGTVRVETSPMRRSAFVHAVAVAAGLASPEAVDDEALLDQVDEQQRAGDVRILVAEDNRTNQHVIRRQLKMLGYACDIVGDGKAALEALDTGAHAILLTDCHMPEMDGYELAAEIRRREQGGARRLPIIAITANALKGEAERCLAAGMDDYLPKPLEMKKLRLTLRRWNTRSRYAPYAAVEDSPAVAVPVPAAAADVPAPAPVPSPAPTLAAAIDERALKDVFGEDPVTFRDILIDFGTSARTIVGEIEAAQADRDAAAVGRAAHKLKSAARAVGAHALADLCTGLEAAGKCGDWTVIDGGREPLAGCLRGVEQFIATL